MSLSNETPQRVEVLNAKNKKLRRDVFKKDPNKVVLNHNDRHYTFQKAGASYVYPAGARVRNAKVSFRSEKDAFGEPVAYLDDLYWSNPVRSHNDPSGRAVIEFLKKTHRKIVVDNASSIPVSNILKDPKYGKRFNAFLKNQGAMKKNGYISRLAAAKILDTPSMNYYGKHGFNRPVEVWPAGAHTIYNNPMNIDPMGERTWVQPSKRIKTGNPMSLIHALKLAERAPIEA